MGTRTLGSTIGTLIVAGVVLSAGALFVAGNGDDSGRTPTAVRTGVGETVVVAVNFTPPHLGTAVAIRVSVDGIPAISAETQKSPWRKEFLAAPDTNIIVRAMSVDKATTLLDCQIVRSGRPAAYDSVMRPGTVRCQHVR